MDINLILVNICTKEIFPILAENNLHCKICSILIYGSRSNNSFHEKSDIDAIILVESDQYINVDFDGNRSGFCLDLKICDLKTILNYICHDHLSYAMNLESCVCTYGDVTSANLVAHTSKQCIEDKINDLVNQIKGDDFYYILGQAEHQLNNYRNYFLSVLEKSTVAFYGRLFELIYDYVRIFIRLYCVYNNIFDRGSLKLLLCLESFKRQACYLEVFKRNWFYPITKLVSSITVWDWYSVSKAINETRKEYFGCIIIKDNNPQDLLLIKEVGINS